MVYAKAAALAALRRSQGLLTPDPHRRVAAQQSRETAMSIETVADLIEQLSECDLSLPVRLAFQPSHPIETSVGMVGLYLHDDRQGVVYLAQGEETDYLIRDAADALGWR